MENQFFIDSKHLSSEALAKKHRLENDPTFRTNHMEYMSAITSLTAQNTIDVRAIQESTPEFLREQLDFGQEAGPIKHNF